MIMFTVVGDMNLTSYAMSILENLPTRCDQQITKLNGLLICQVSQEVFVNVGPNLASDIQSVLKWS